MAEDNFFETVEAEEKLADIEAEFGTDARALAEAVAYEHMLFVRQFGRKPTEEERADMIDQCYCRLNKLH
ncbi:hypothetical protein NJB93_19545 [Brucella intermedia]|uniref:hypothetical protein n=1 Tax=Brucella intermedia TaxID=94625 RepID=UPI00209B21FD|nr:hypothetical protein [Brucella intermedia]MCO7728777.1 hypothetical protein [Brucella intermedia]